MVALNGLSEMPGRSGGLCSVPPETSGGMTEEVGLWGNCDHCVKPIALYAGKAGPKTIGQRGDLMVGLARRKDFLRRRRPGQQVSGCVSIDAWSACAAIGFPQFVEDHVRDGYTSCLVGLKGMG